MSVRNMESLFQPKSIAVFGTRNDTDGLAARVVYNLRACGFPGPVIPISAGASAVASAIVYPDSAHLPFAPDLAVLCTPFDGMPALIDDLGLKPRVAFGAVRLAITGRRISPPLFESMELLGRARSMSRLRGLAAELPTPD